MTDLTPTFLDYAGVPQPGSTYNGTEVHPIMGKSLQPLFNGSVQEIRGADDPIGLEMFNNSALYKGDCIAIKDNSHPTGKGWELYNIAVDPVQNNDLGDEHAAVLQEMIADYHKYAEEVGVVVPTGEKAAIQYSGIYPALNQTQTIELDKIIPPFKRPNASAVIDALGSY